MASQVDIQPNPAHRSFTGPLQVKVKPLDSNTVIPTFAYQRVFHGINNKQFSLMIPAFNQPSLILY